ncbi:MAG TPA: hypothetical protein VHQ03_02350 [Candidatus Dormibacteraeota bacterium]|nr:hypothetical protein [Candidatus Dormibacteraeota bacterium]
MPAEAFLLSIAGLGVSLAGFSGLVAAFRRGAGWKPLDAYRLRQIPEMGLATAVTSLATIPTAGMLGAATSAIRAVAVLALAFTLVQVLVLWFRARAMGFKLSTLNVWVAAGIDLGVYVAGAAAIVTAAAWALEWTLILLLARPMLAFVLVLADVSAPD